MATALPLALYFGLNNKTFNLKIDDHSSWFYNIKLKSMHIDSASVGAPSVFEQLPGTDKIHIKISKIDT
jgi:hypothetical protein